MNFASMFHIGKIRPSLPLAHGSSHQSLPLTQVDSPPGTIEPTVNQSQPESTGANDTEIENIQRWCLPTQLAWIEDPHPLRIWEKSRQVGATKTDALDSVLKAGHADARFDVWVSSRDELQASFYLEDCRQWAKILHLAATFKGRVLLDRKNNSFAYVLEFANGRRKSSCREMP